MSDLARDADLFDFLLHGQRWFGREATDDFGDDEVEQHTDRADPLGRDAEEPVRTGIEFGVDELEVDDVGRREDDADDHATDGTFFVHLLIKNP